MLAVLAASAAAIFAALTTRASDWQPIGLLMILLIVYLACDLLQAATKSLRVSGSFLALALALALLGPAPAAAIGVAAVVFERGRRRGPAAYVAIELAAYVIFPVVAGTVFRVVVDSLHLRPEQPEFLLAVIPLFMGANLLNFLLIASGLGLLDRVPVTRRFRVDYLPVLGWELATALLTVGVVALYANVGLPAIALAAIVILTFQYLLRELLTSQHRAEQLEERTTQLAGMQVGILAAMVQTLGLRDRMTARHSAAVARYSRELAAAAGRSEREQEIVHTAALLHDIGKFALPDSILLGGHPLSDDDWALIRRHPEEGARVLRRVDGYGPIADIVLAHHERVDGTGYPQGTAGDDIPLFARMISVADAYDVMTARDSYRTPMTSHEAIEELRRSAGSHFDGWIVETFIGVLERRGVEFRHGDDADFEAELAFERRVRAFLPSAA